jgi:hypothetical protein
VQPAARPQQLIGERGSVDSKRYEFAITSRICGYPDVSFVIPTLDFVAEEGVQARIVRHYVASPNDHRQIASVHEDRLVAS